MKTNLGGRVQREEKSFFDLVAYERKASIFTPAAADTIENAETLRALLDLDQKLQAAAPNEDEIAAAADAFVKGSDKMKLHRQIYAARAFCKNASHSVRSSRSQKRRRVTPTSRLIVLRPVPP